MKSETLCTRIDDKRVKRYDKINSACSAVIAVLTMLLGLIVLTYALFSPILVDGTSMENSYHDGQTVIMMTFWSSPNRGDVVIVKHEDENFIKRVVAVGGDRVGFVKDDSSDRVYLYVDKGNGFEKQTETYIKDGLMTDRREVFTDIRPYLSEQALNLGGGLKLASDELYLLGDNREHSADSRKYGPFKESDVKGKVVGVVDNAFLKTIFTLLYGDVEA